MADNIADKLVMQLSQPQSLSASPDGTSMERLILAIDQMIDFATETPETSMFVIKEIARQDTRLHYIYERLKE